MADVRKIVTISPTGTVTTLADFEASGFASERDTFQITPPAVTPILTQAQRPYGGGRTVNQIHANGSISLVLLVSGATHDAAMLSVSNTLAILLTPRTDLYFEWRPEGVTSSVYYQITGPATYESTYSWITWQSSKRLPIKITLPVAPLARGAAVDYAISSTGMPTVVSLANIPGDAPALADVTLRMSSGTAAPIWALFGWYKKPGPTQMAINGGFETNASGWFTSSLTHNTNPTSLTRITSQFKYGVASGQVVSPATANNGPEYIIHRPFKAGVTYTAKIWMRAGSGSDLLSLAFGRTGEVAVSSNITSSTTWQEATATWTPSSNWPYAVVAPRHNAASARTWEIDGLRVYEGTTAPTLDVQGSGAHAPLGVIRAEASETLAGFTYTTPGGFNETSYLLSSGAAGNGSASMALPIDSSTITPDDFSIGTIDVEIYARMFIDTGMSSLRILTLLAPYAGSDYGVPTYTAEYGSAGKPIPAHTGTSVWQMVRLGTLTIPVDQYAPLKWYVRVSSTWAAATTSSFLGIDYFVMVPARARAASKTGVSPDAYYAKFISSTLDTSKTIRGADLSGMVGSAALNMGRDSGLGGSLIELPPGNAEMALKTSTAVPDDPTVATTGIADNDQPSWTVTGNIRVTPRYHLAKGA